MDTTRLTLVKEQDPLNKEYYRYTIHEVGFIDNNPVWIGVDNYIEKHGNVFYGRKNETDFVANAIRKKLVAEMKCIMDLMTALDLKAVDKDDVV